MTTPANRDELLQRIREEREALERAVARVPAEKMTEPLLEGGWSVKDVLAHIAAWEGLMVGWVEESLRGGTPDRPVTGDDDTFPPGGPHLSGENRGAVAAGTRAGQWMTSGGGFTRTLAKRRSQ